MKTVRLILKNTVRNPRRTALTILSITVCIFLVSTLQAVLHNLESLGESNSSNLRVVVHRATGLTESMPVAYKQRIAALPGVKYVSRWIGSADTMPTPATSSRTFPRMLKTLKRSPTNS